MEGNGDVFVIEVNAKEETNKLSWDRGYLYSN